jgi:EamA domain-containing membrane protein RarD
MFLFFFSSASDTSLYGNFLIALFSVILFKTFPLFKKWDFRCHPTDIITYRCFSSCGNEMKTIAKTTITTIKRTSRGVCCLLFAKLKKIFSKKIKSILLHWNWYVVSLIVWNAITWKRFDFQQNFVEKTKTSAEQIRKEKTSKL